MDDLIDRQAAIDKIVETSDEIYKIKQKGATYPHDDFFQGMAYAENIVKQLPSAQPEIVRCKDCDWWTKQEDSPQGRCELLQMYPTGGWFCGNARRREVTK